MIRLLRTFPAEKKKAGSKKRHGQKRDTWPCFLRSGRRKRVPISAQRKCPLLTVSQERLGRPYRDNTEAPAIPTKLKGIQLIIHLAGRWQLTLPGKEKMSVSKNSMTQRHKQQRRPGGALHGNLEVVPLAPDMQMCLDCMALSQEEFHRR